MNQFINDNLVTILLGVTGSVGGAVGWLWVIAKWVTAVEEQAKSLEKAVSAMKEQHDKDWKAMAAQMHEDKQERLRDRGEVMEYLKEVRQDVKTLIAKVGDK